MYSRDWKEHIQRVLQENQIHTVRVCVHDNANIQRSRFVSVRHFINSVLQDDISYPSVLYSMDTSATIHTEAGDGFAGGYPSWILKPDLGTFGVVPYAPGTARIIADLYSNDKKPVVTSPRYVLRKMINEFSNEGLRVRGAFEYEFYVFRQTDKGIEPVWDGLQCFSEIKQSEVEELISSVMLNFTEMGAGPEVANTEYGSGQFEVTNSPFWGMEIADMAFYYRTSIKEILQKKGYIATFMSKPVAETSGSGAHNHLSLYDQDNNNLFFDSQKDDGLSDMCRWFIGGQLMHAKALCALVNPTINSYKRLQNYSFAPTTASWGYEHRGAMIRVPAGRNDHTRLENRLPGADTNPYVALAAILAAGLDGIKNQIDPLSPVVNKDAYDANFERLPHSLPEALTALKNDRLFFDSLGEEFIEHYLKLRQGEWERFNRHVTDWELKEYMDLI